MVPGAFVRVLFPTPEKPRQPGLLHVGYALIVTATEASVHAVVYLDRHPTASGRLVRLPEGTATERSRRELYSAGEIRTKHEKILEILSKTPTFALHYHEFDQAIQQLDRLALDARTNPRAPTL